MQRSDPVKEAATGALYQSPYRSTTNGRFGVSHAAL